MPRSPLLHGVVVGVVSLALAATGLLSAGSATAAVPTPLAPTFGAGIDPYSSYEVENTCSPTPKPGVVAWRDVLIRTYGSRWNNISRACSSSDSGHEEGRALDYGSLATDATQKAQADALLNWLLATDSHGNKNAMVRRLGIQYIMFNNRMWRAYDPSAGWQSQMSGGTACSNRGSSYVTTCHRDHIHFSFAWAGAKKQTSYFTGGTSCPTPTTPNIAFPTPVNLTPVPVTTTRIFDSRSGSAACRLPPNGYIDVKVTGVGGVPSSGVGAVALNVTGVSTGAATFLSVYPAGTPWTGTSSLRVPAAAAAVSLVVVPVGSNGMVRVRNGAALANVAVDVTAYFTTTATGSGYSPVPEKRMLDTRQTSIMGKGERRVLQVAGKFGVPTGAAGVLVNVTSLGSTDDGHLTVAASLPSSIGTATVKYLGGEARGNRAISGLAADGTLSIYAYTPTHMTIDIVGWFGTGGNGLRYSALAPNRIVDTRSGVGGASTLVAGRPATVTLAGQNAIPSDARAVVGTLTLLKPSVPTTATVYAAAHPSPTTSDISLNPGSIRENVIGPELSAGKAAFSVSKGSADAVLDVLGYFR